MTEQPPISDPIVGRTIDGRYHIDEVIASGGMATVYRATDVRLQRSVAVKVMHAHLAADQQFRDRFLSEALASAKLAHPNIVNVYDQGHEAGLWYLVMEYVPNITLRDLLRKRRSLSPHEALSIFSPALAGLAAAHDAGILHRDLKPENILLADDGRVKLADFGLARAVSDHTSPTQSLIGSVAYMSPELLSRGRADARSDIYAMGIILYEMLVGARPFRSKDAVQIALQHANDPVPLPSASNPNIPVDVDELVQWATAKQPDDRPRNAHILREQTDDIIATLGTDSGSVPPAVLQRTAPTRVLTSVPPPPELARTTVLDTATAQSAAVAIKPPQPRQPGNDVEKLQRLGRSGSRRGGMLLLIVLLLAAFAAGTGWYFGDGPGAMTSIPDVTSLSEEEAKATLETQGFLVESTRVHDLNIPSGTVMSTDPSGGSNAFTGSTVSIVVSSGPANAKIPSVIGADRDAATEALEERGFVIATKINYRFSTEAADTVLSLSAGKKSIREGQSVRQGTKISLTLSLGSIPSVVGSTQESATTTLQDAGLKVRIASTKFSDTVAKGLVISQSNEKEVMAKGDTVSLVVSKGQDLVAIPTGMVGQSVDSANAALEAAGFDVVIDNDWLPDVTKQLATVSRTDPAEGTQVKRGSTVTIYWTFTSG